jgi:transposase-like protein
MKNEKLTFPPGFFKQFKTASDLEDFFRELYKEGVQQMLQAEMDEHLGYEKYSSKGFHSGNSRNGTSQKTLKTSVGDIPVDIPRDRNSEFEPVVVPKYQTISEKIENAIIGMYSRGMNTRDVEEQIKEIYGVDVSETTVSNITSKMVSAIKEWQSRPLEPVYFAVWMDGISFKIRQNGKIINKTIFLVIGLNKQGLKEVLGMWINETESASFWMQVLTDLKARGVEDILIASTDNLAGFSQAIAGAFPKTIVQLCVVHQIRNSLRYVVWKDKKEFVLFLKAIYAAINRQEAEIALKAFEQKWGAKYGYAVKSWMTNWDLLTQYFDFPLEIRKIIYTTNPIESLNSTIRKYTKNKPLFPDDQAATKAVFFAIQNIQRKWTQPIRNWGLILNQFLTIFEERCRL